MTSEEFRFLIPQYLAEQLSWEQVDAFETCMAEHGELREEVDELRWFWNGLGLLPEPQPSAALRARFYQQLNSSSAKPGRRTVTIGLPDWFRGWIPQIAFGAAIFLAGIYFGRVGDAAKAEQKQLAEMRSQVQSLQQTVALSLLERQSAASRLEGVEWTDRLARPDTQVMNALIGTLNHDPNVNVRLSSIDALARFSDEAEVRKVLLDSMARQDSPLVQIALIDELVQMRENKAVHQLRTLSRDASVNSSVRQRAEWAVAKLEQPPASNDQ